MSHNHGDVGLTRGRQWPMASRSPFIVGAIQRSDGAGHPGGHDALWDHRKTIEQLDELLGATHHPGADPNQRKYGSDIPG